MDINKVPKSELSQRMSRFLGEMDKVYDNWEVCGLTGALSTYYLTGTICDGLLLIRRGGERTLWVRRSYGRALIESEFSDIRRMSSFRDVAAGAGTLPDTLYLDTAHASMEWYGLLSRYLPFKNVLPVDNVMLGVRAVKSEYELERMRLAGSLTNRLLREELPKYLRDGISEAELGGEMFLLFMKNGHHGMTRFSMRNTEMSLGHIGFGESPLFPSVFNGASGTAGICPAVPILGGRGRHLRKGDLIYADLALGIEGYNIDKTLVFSYRIGQPEHVSRAQRHCLELERRAADMLRPGVRPSDIYREIFDSVDPEFKNGFMGAPGRTVPFLGHGVGLYVDEMPALAKGFDAPLEPGMTIAIEPKIGIEGVGMAGSENTYLVTETGGVSITGESSDIIIVE